VSFDQNLEDIDEPRNVSTIARSVRALPATPWCPKAAKSAVTRSG